MGFRLGTISHEEFSEAVRDALLNENEYVKLAIEGLLKSYEEVCRNIECAIVMLTRTKGWTKLKAWGLKIMRRSGIKKAAAAVARKLAIIMLRMWQEGKPFVYGEKKEKAKSLELKKSSELKSIVA